MPKVFREGMIRKGPVGVLLQNMQLFLGNAGAGAQMADDNKFLLPVVVDVRAIHPGRGEVGTGTERPVKLRQTLPPADQGPAAEAVRVQRQA